MARRTHVRIPFGRYFTPIGEEFASVEALGACGLAIATVVALVWANAWTDSYADVWGRDLTIGPSRIAITHDLRHWVTDGLMAVFFFVVGLEIKRELVVGALRDRRFATLPFAGALGGMLVPAAIFFAINPSAPERDGWGIPMATDLAFVLGVLVLVRSRVPPELKLFILTLAIVDDIGSILVITVVYPEGVTWGWLGGALGVLGLFFVLRRFGVHSPFAYVLPALAVWVCISKAGVPGAVTGAGLGLLAPADTFHGRPVIDQLEHHLHPWATFLVVPLFALANAGIDIDGDALSSSVAVGVIVARVIGKTVGIVLAVELALRLGIGRLPTGLARGHIAGVAALAGIGFTVALVVADLSYTGTGLLGEAKVGLFVAALGSAALGALILLLRARRTVST